MSLVPKQTRFGTTAHSRFEEGSPGIDPEPTDQEFEPILAITVGVSAGRDSQGKRVRLTKRGFRTRREAKAWEAQQTAKMERGFDPLSEITINE
jgi:hypothetical protein